MPVFTISASTLTASLSAQLCSTDLQQDFNSVRYKGFKTHLSDMLTIFFEKSSKVPASARHSYDSHRMNRWVEQYVILLGFVFSVEFNWPVCEVLPLISQLWISANILHCRVQIFKHYQSSITRTLAPLQNKLQNLLNVFLCPFGEYIVFHARLFRCLPIKSFDLA